jgi:TPR repeat protein
VDNETKKIAQSVDKVFSEIHPSTIAKGDSTSKAIHRALTFLTYGWDADAFVSELKPEDLDLLWLSYRKLFGNVLEVIKTKITYFYTDACKIADKYNDPCEYTNLIFLGARKSAADHGLDIAQFCMGYCAMFLNIGNYDEGLNYMKLAAEQSLTAAENIIASLYLGMGREYQVPAIRLLEKASVNGSVEAMYNLGEVFSGRLYNGLFDPEKSISYFKSAAQLGYAPAFIKLGEYECNRPGGRLPQAIFYYREALDRGDFEAQKFLNRCLEIREEMEVLAKQLYHSKNPPPEFLKMMEL